MNLSRDRARSVHMLLEAARSLGASVPCPHRVDVTVHRDGRVTCNACQEVIGRTQEPGREDWPENMGRFAEGDR